MLRHRNNELRRNAARSGGTCAALMAPFTRPQARDSPHKDAQIKAWHRIRARVVSIRSSLDCARTHLRIGSGGAGGADCNRSAGRAAAGDTCGEGTGGGSDEDRADGGDAAACAWEGAAA
jgi:hypothetical protein